MIVNTVSQEPGCLNLSVSGTYFGNTVLARLVYGSAVVLALPNRLLRSRANLTTPISKKPNSDHNISKMGSSSLDEWDDPPEPQSLVGYGQPPLEIVSDDELKEVLP